MQAILLFVSCCFLFANASDPSLFEPCDGAPAERNATTPGLISSPGWPNGSYPSNSRCEWVLYQEDGELLELKFLNFTLEISEGCKSDYVEVFDGSDDTGFLRGRYCGQQVPPTIHAPDNTPLFVRFVSDALINYPGFLARYGVPSSRNSCSVNSPEVIENEQGVIFSDNYPADYPNSLRCGWRFEAEVGETWTININDLMTENCCNCDFLRIHDGFDTFAPSLGLWHGLNTIVPEITSSSNYLYVHFETDSSLSYRGFFGRYRKNASPDKAV